MTKITNVAVAVLALAALSLLALVAPLPGPAVAQQTLPKGTYLGPIDASSGIVTAAQVTATLPAAANVINALTSFEATANNASAGCYAVQVSGIAGGPFIYYYCIPGGSSAENPLLVQFHTPLIASGPNTAITVQTQGALSAGVSGVINVHGFRFQ